MIIKRHIFSKVLLQLLQFFTGLLIARNLGAEKNGVFSLFITEASFFILLVGLSFESTIIFFVTKKKITLPQINNLIIKLFGIQIIIFFFAISLLLIFSKIVTYKNVVLDVGVFPVFLFVFSSIILNSVEAIFYANNIVYKYNIYLVSSYVILLIGFLINSFYSFINTSFIVSMIYVYTIFIFTLAIFSIVIMFLTFKNINLKISQNAKFNKEIIKYTFIVFIANLIQFLCYKIDFWIIDYYGTKKQVGLYAIASKIAQLWWVMPLILASIFFPLISIGEINNNYFKKVLFKILIFSIITGILANFIYPYFIQTFVGNEFAESYFPFILLLPGVIFFSLNILLAAKYSGEGSVSINLKAAMFCFIIIFILDFTLIPKFGINGAAIASTIAYSSSTIYAIKQYNNAKAK